MKLRRSRNSRSRSTHVPEEEPRLRFEAPALVDTLHPSEDELVALDEVSEHPPDIGASIHAALEESAADQAG